MTHSSMWKHAENWVTQQVGPIEKVEIIKDTDVSTVIKIETSQNSYFFKATGEGSRFEGQLSAHIASVYPTATAPVVAVHLNEPWFIMEVLIGTPLREQKDKAFWQQALQEYARLQVQECKNVEALLAIGVPDRRMAILKEEIRTHLADMCTTGLTEEETQQVLALETELLDMCDFLEALVPASIEHGDLHTNNIMNVHGKPIFFDWGDSSISHPFFSTRIYWHVLEDLIESKADWLGIVEEFRPFYLEPWTEFASMDDLEKGLRLSDELACVQRALTWHLYITPQRQNKEETYGRPAQWLRLFLEHRQLVGK